MERDRQMMASLITAVLAVGVMTIATNAHAVDTSNQPQKLEKCFGVVKAGRNDCDTNNGSCTPSVIDASPEHWIYLPVGVCEKLVGGSTVPGVNDSTKDAAMQDIINATGNSPASGTVDNSGAEMIDSAPIMQDDMILDGGAGLTGGANNSSGKSNTPSGNSPTQNVAPPSNGPIPTRPATELNQY